MKRSFVDLVVMIVLQENRFIIKLFKAQKQGRNFIWDGKILRLNIGVWNFILKFCLSEAVPWVIALNHLSSFIIFLSILENQWTSTHKIGQKPINRRDFVWIGSESSKQELRTLSVWITSFWLFRPLVYPLYRRKKCLYARCDMIFLCLCNPSSDEDEWANQMTS